MTRDQPLGYSYPYTLYWAIDTAPTRATTRVVTVIKITTLVHVLRSAEDLQKQANFYILFFWGALRCPYKRLVNYTFLVCNTLRCLGKIRGEAIERFLNKIGEPVPVLRPLNKLGSLKTVSIKFKYLVHSDSTLKNIRAKFEK